MKILKLLLLLPLLLCCKVDNPNSVSALVTENNSDKAAITITMEGQTYTIQQNELMPLKLNFEKDSLAYSLYTKDKPVQINFNLFNTNILTKGVANYTIPEVNSGPIKVDLSLFNKERDAKRINKRIVFRKGNITVKEITKHKLIMNFKGEASGMIDSKNSFPISGSIHINY